MPESSSSPRRWSPGLAALPPGAIPRRRELLAQHLRSYDLDAGLVRTPASVAYYTGNDIAGGVALVVEAGGRCLVVADEYDAFNLESLGDQALEVRTVPYLQDWWRVVVGSLRRYRCVGLETAGLPHVQRQALEAHRACTFAPIDDQVRRQRLVKSPAEIHLLRRAAAALAAAFGDTRRELRRQTSEAQVARTIYGRLIGEGSEAPASQPYVKAGERALLTHARWSQRPIGVSEHVLVEAAACVGRYHVALMRTRLAASRNRDYRRAVAAVLEARDTYLTTARPGIPARKLHAAYRATLQRHGVCEWNRHASGYSLGLAFPPYWGEVDLLTVSQHATTILQPGMILHLIAGLTDPARLLPHVGLSESVLITDGGFERLVDVPDFL
jgi:Xaa-Pro dipeptidase